MKIAIGCDHGGIVLKEAVLAELKKRGVTVQDFGTMTADSCDYPDFGLKVAESVALGKSDKGIVLCGTGIGISIAANKVKGIRAAVCHDLFTAEVCSAHNNANVLSIGGRIVKPELAAAIVGKWLDTPFEGGRHARRVDKITEIESKYFK